MRTRAGLTETTRKRYDRNACFYDLMEGFMEKSRFSRWREVQWGKIEGTHILEVGVGTGKNFPYYPSSAEMTAIDFSNRMLDRAREKARRQNVNVQLLQMDVQDLKFESDTFDTVIASFVFCSVPDPIAGLKEVRRVCKQGGKVLLLEHVRSANRVLGILMDFINPGVLRITGANINRRTVQNVSLSGLVVERVTSLGAGIFKLIEARKKNSI